MSDAVVTCTSCGKPAKLRVDRNAYRTLNSKPVCQDCYHLKYPKHPTPNVPARRGRPAKKRLSAASKALNDRRDRRVRGQNVRDSLPEESEEEWFLLDSVGFVRWRRSRI